MLAMRSKLVIFYLGLFVLVGLSSCHLIKPLEMSKVDSVKIEDFKSGELTLKLIVKVKNPNCLNFKIKDNHLDLSINNLDVGIAKVKEAIVIRKYSDDSHEFLVGVTPSKMTLIGVVGLIGILRDKPVELKVKGEIQVKTLGISRKYPVEIKEKIDLKELGKNFLN
jgi:LEA14-like dessication related protein